MTNTMILHHYDGSPYAEKIRLMFGLTGSNWQSLIAPAWPPRPNLDPLTGGYRRIPVAQIGADIFCDTAIIGEEVAALTGSAALDKSQVDSEALALMTKAEKEVFFSAIRSISPLRLITTMLLSFGPIGMSKFAKDRGQLMKGGSSRAPSPEQAKNIMSEFLAELEQRLSVQEFLSGSEAGLADLTVYHPLWLHVSCTRKPLKAGKHVTQWFARVAELGHGRCQEIDAAAAHAAARDNEPRVLTETGSDDLLGKLVAVAPTDYGLVPVAGRLISLTDSRIIVARDTADYGTLHVHFPRADFGITPA